MQWKIYLKGFFKGLGILFVAGLFIAAIDLLRGENIYHVRPNILYNALYWLLSLFFISYIVTKNHKPKCWMILAIFLSILTIPFLFGSLEADKIGKAKK